MPRPNPFIVIACGGTGGHLFPGLAIAEVLQQRACDIALLVSPKEVDQEAVKSVIGMEVMTLPAIALQNADWLGFLKGCLASHRICSEAFKRRRPDAVLAMGGFTSAPPILAGKFTRAATFLHESNAIPGRANRWLSPLVDEAFVGFQMAARRLRNQCVKVVGTPVRPPFKPLEPAACRMAIGLDPAKPVLLVMGGSQGASGLNDLLRQALPTLAARLPELQFVHLTGSSDREKVAADYSAHKRRAVVFPFLTEMELALGAATVALSRSGASSLAEFAAMRVPAILVPLPSAVDNHQFYNARAFAETGAALQVDQASVPAEKLAGVAVELIANAKYRATIMAALERWHYPNAAEKVADSILKRLGVSEMGPSRHDAEPSKGPGSHRPNNPSDHPAKPQLFLAR